jgi:hypothetical protein
VDVEERLAAGIRTTAKKIANRYLTTKQLGSISFAQIADYRTSAILAASFSRVRG